MKITLTPKLADTLLKMLPEESYYVLHVCKSLMELDDDAIENFQLEDDEPPLLHDILNEMKKRVAAARRRSQRRAAKTADKKANPQANATSTAVTAAPDTVDSSVAVYTDAIAAMFANPATVTPSQFKRIMELAGRILRYINSVPAHNKVNELSRKARRMKSRKKR
ncbi:MAG: hypothetical protein K2M68_00895 [Muribaculaceae bacterium]|nr:hypothetical protein [Muribaculaceae bacterium]